MGSLNHKVVLITGASSGIGRATTIAFANKGAKVALAARRSEKLREIQEDILSYGGECIYVTTDTTNEEEVKGLFYETENRIGTIEILVNCAGKGMQRYLRDTTHEEWLSVLGANLTSVFLCTREAEQRMIATKTRGHIITVSSIAGFYGAPKYSAYSASKHGVTGFQRSIKWELRKHGIKVSTVHPFRVDTEFFDAYEKRPHRGQMLSPEDIGSYIVAIASGSKLKRIFKMGSNLGKRIWNLSRFLAR